MTTVILVDDDLFVRSRLADLLQRAGIQVAGGFRDGTEAVEAVHAGLRPDVALVDIAMPNLPGPAVVRELRRLVPELPVIALTSLADEASAASMIQAGASGFVTKDTPIPAMIHAIRAAASGMAVLSPVATGLLGSGHTPTDRPELSEREVEILTLLCEGLENQEIAPRVFLSEHTVKYHVSRLMQKLAARNRASLAAKAKHLGYC